MIQHESVPFECHLFVCTHTRNGDAKACLDGSSDEVRAVLKAEVKKRGISDRVRVSQSGCLGLCADGPNVVIYPQKIWFSGVRPEDTAAILETVEGILSVK